MGETKQESATKKLSASAYISGVEESLLPSRGMAVLLVEEQRGASGSVPLPPLSLTI
ncbi:MAG: hypothetical protein ACRD5B_17210 [Nitrososphaeraceae archaeon]